jgi:hypothetical protein
VQRFVGAPILALEGTSTLASLRYALMYPRMELRLTASWCRETFPRQRWIPLQWPQERWPDDGTTADWIPAAELGVAVPLQPAVALQFADRFEAEILRALAPAAGLRGVPSRRLRAAARVVWRHDGAVPEPALGTSRADADPPPGLLELPEATVRLLRFAADLFDQITWVRRWAELGHPLGIDWTPIECRTEPESIEGTFDPDSAVEPTHTPDATDAGVA